MFHLNRKSFFRVADAATLLASCTAAGVIALKLGVTVCGVGLLALGGAFLATDLWRIGGALAQHRAVAALPGAQAWRRSSAPRSIALPPRGD